MVSLSSKVTIGIGEDKHEVKSVFYKLWQFRKGLTFQLAKVSAIPPTFTQTIKVLV